MSITYKRELITPQRARQLLDSNAENQRLPKKNKIPQYARDMAAGNWHANTGETIKVDVDGRVLDGQNRLRAVIMADTSIYFDIAYDVPTDAMQVIDTGVSRTAADVLRIAGAASRFRSAAIVRWVIMWDAGLPMGNGGTLRPTTSEVMQRYLAEPAAFDAAGKRAGDCQGCGLGTGSAAGVAHYLFGRMDMELTQQFFDQYVSGANLPPKSAVLTLRNRMARIKADRITRQEQLALFIRAFNAFHEGRTLDQLIIVKNDLSNSNFPALKKVTRA